MIVLQAREVDKIGTSEMADIFGVTAATIRNWAKSGRLEEAGITVFRLPSGLWKFDRQEAEAFYEGSQGG